MELKISKEIYARNSVDAAVTAYRNHADILIRETLADWRLVFRHCKYDPKLTTKEFENYLIGLENQ